MGSVLLTWYSLPSFPEDKEVLLSMLDCGQTGKLEGLKGDAD